MNAVPSILSRARKQHCTCTTYYSTCKKTSYYRSERLSKNEQGGLLLCSPGIKIVIFFCAFHSRSLSSVNFVIEYVRTNPWFSIQKTLFLWQEKRRFKRDSFEVLPARAPRSDWAHSGQKIMLRLGPKTTKENSFAFRRCCVVPKGHSLIFESPPTQKSLHQKFVDARINYGPGLWFFGTHLQCAAAYTKLCKQDIAKIETTKERGR